MQRLVMSNSSQQFTLLTGASGFIGQHLFSHLTDLNYSVIPFIRNQNKDLSLSDFGSVKQYCFERKISSIVHLASMVKNIKSPRDIDNEVSMAVTLLSALKPGGKFIYFSTADVYADTSDILCEDSLLGPSNAYAKAKLKAEKALIKLATLKGVDLVILRPSLVYGSGVPAGMFLADLLQSLRDGVHFYYSSRPIVRDLIHVYDVASAVAEILSQEKHVGGIYNLSTGIGNSLSDIVEMVKCISGCELSVQRDVSKGVGASHTIVLNPKKLQMAINWYPSVSIGMGLRDFLS